MSKLLAYNFFYRPWMSAGMIKGLSIAYLIVFTVVGMCVGMVASMLLHL